VLSAAEPVAGPLPAASAVAIAAAAVEAPAVTVNDWIIVPAEDGGAAAPGVAAGAVAPACETIGAAALCAAAAELDAAGPTAVELDGALVRAGGETAGVDAAGGGRLPVGGKDAPPVPAVPALPGSLLRPFLPVT
jgi:hypothetical protein